MAPREIDAEIAQLESLLGVGGQQRVLRPAKASAAAGHFFYRTLQINHISKLASLIYFNFQYNFF